MQGMPKGRNLPGCFFGISTCRTGFATCPFPQVPRQFPQPALRLDVLEALPVSADGEPAPRSESLLATPCRTKHETAAWGPPSLSHVLEFPDLTLLDSCQSTPCLLSMLLSTQGPFRYPLLRYYGPIRHPDRRLMCAASLPVLPPSSPSMRASVTTPTEADRCPRRSLPHPPTAFP